MTSTLKFVLITALTMTVAVPGFASDGHRALTKGSKSYQSASKSAQPDKTTAVENNADVTKIEPAAGAMTPDQPQAEKGKSFKEEMRLPRKN